MHIFLTLLEQMLEHYDHLILHVITGLVINILNGDFNLMGMPQSYN